MGATGYGRPGRKDLDIVMTGARVDFDHHAVKSNTQSEEPPSRGFFRFVGGLGGNCLASEVRI